MIGHVVGVAFLVAMATCQDAHWKMDMIMMNGTQPNQLLQQYRNSSQAQQADTNRDNRIDTNEFAQALYAQADVNTDGRVDQAEFLDDYRRRLPFMPSEVLVVMFDLLDDLNPDPNVPVPANFTPPCNPQVNVFSNVADFGDGVLSQQDVSIQVFTESNTPSVEDFQKALNVWVEAAAKKVHMSKSRPFLVGKHYDVEYDFDLFFSHVDANRDDVITTDEIAAEMSRFSSTGSVSRSDWVSRNTETYGQNRLVAMVLFDYLDDNNDLTLNADDVRTIIMWADANHDDRTTKQELFRFMQRKDKTIRRMLGLPIKPFVYDCPDPVWNDDDDCEAVVDATLMTMDADYNFDGNVTVMEMKQQLMSIDHNMDGKVDRVEFLKFDAERYSVDMAAADLEFDAIDMDGDGYFTWRDYERHFVNDTQWMCACEYRLSALATVRAARHLAKERQTKMDLTRMKYMVMMNEGLRTMETDHQQAHGAMGTWQWRTMNGRPAKGGCTACSPKDNWGMTGEMKDNDKLSDEEHKMMQMMMEAMQKMNMMQHWGQRDATWRMMHLLMHAMQMMQQQAKGDNQAMPGVNEMAEWMTWTMNTMRMDNHKAMGMVQGHGSVWGVMGEMEGQGQKKEGEEKQGMSWPAWMEWQPEGGKKEEEEEEEKGAFDKFMDWYKEEQEKKKMEKEEKKKEEEDKKMQDMKNEWPQWQNWQGWQGWHPKNSQDPQEEKEEKSEWEKFMAWHAQQERKM
ncbi:uncharacterized protein [Littorina saxatilis]|uniref:EF-hand domain-containing protein n=1 Tax=Littorina saxatilis TaxID=31220 RepID=A0AAN9FXR2_9CAEN